jgi:glucokinase
MSDVVVADIGGTHARLARLDADGGLADIRGYASGTVLLGE